MGFAKVQQEGWLMATATITTAPGAIEEIENLGFKWSTRDQYDLDTLSVDRRVQVRETAHYAPKESVERFAVQMGEVPFPPIVVTSDGWIVDGNTRVGAKLLRKEKFSPAVVLDVKYDSASEKQRDMLHALAATLNQLNGIPLTSKEVRAVAERLIRLGWKTEQIGRAIGVKGTTVTQVKRELDAVHKLQRVGLSPNGALGGTSLRALGASSVVGLNDVPFKELAALAADAGFNAGEITSTAKQLRELGSDQAAIEELDRIRVEMGDRIQEKRLTGSAKPPVSRQLRQHLGFVTKFAGREQELLETDPKVNAAHIETLTAAISVLATVLRMQKGE